MTDFISQTWKKAPKNFWQWILLFKSDLIVAGIDTGIIYLGGIWELHAASVLNYYTALSCYSALD